MKTLCFDLPRGISAPVVHQVSREANPIVGLQTTEDSAWGSEPDLDGVVGPTF